MTQTYARINTSRYAIGSFTSEKAYELTINEQGEATDCKCADCHFRHPGDCKHIRAFNIEVQRAAAFILVERQIREMQETTRRAYREMAFETRY